MFLDYKWIILVVTLLSICYVNFRSPQELRDLTLSRCLYTCVSADRNIKYPTKWVIINYKEALIPLYLNLHIY